jgi:hypothetical protein
MVFAVASHPFFAEIEAKQLQLDKGLPCAACFRCCADDAGAALASYKMLKLFAPMFRKAELFGGLSLKPKKCVLVPTDYQDF